MIAHGIAALVLPWVLVGVITRTKSLWSGRKGPPILQHLWDALRLMRKTPVYSETTSAVFRWSPWIGLATALATASVVPILGLRPPVSFGWDWVWLAYAWGLGRVATMLGALDTGSSFEGMGASREATFAALVEPALFLAMGALCVVTGSATLFDALAVPLDDGGSVVVWATSLFVLLVVLQAEGARIPVDDPTTHLELTMVHEVMVLDHSGPDLAAIEWASALKVTLAASLIAALTNPWLGEWLGVVWNVGAVLGVGVVVGTIESLIARLQLRAVPQYLFAAVVAGAVAVIATTWQGVAP